MPRRKVIMAFASASIEIRIAECSFIDRRQRYHGVAEEEPVCDARVGKERAQGGDWKVDQEPRNACRQRMVCQ